MEQEEDRLWEVFRSTGSVKAYLEFCAKRKENATKAIENVNSDKSDSH